jgi:predicted metalloprotease
MFGMLESLVKAAVGVVVQTPVALVADALTLGGTQSDRKESYTSQAVSDVVKNIDNAVKPS